MYTKNNVRTSIFLVRFLAVILLVISISVLAAWHEAQRVTAVYSALRTMAYTTAIGLLLSGIALLAAAAQVGITWQDQPHALKA